MGAALQALGKAGSAGGASITSSLLHQMQGVAASGSLAPSDMPGFQAVAGSGAWTNELPGHGECRTLAVTSPMSFL
jgi:hypothetical protein